MDTSKCGLMSFYASRFTFQHEPRLKLRSFNMIPNKISWLSLIFRSKGIRHDIMPRRN